MTTKTSIMVLAKTFFILLVMCCFSCVDQKTEEKAIVLSIDDSDIPYDGIKILTIDSCEYVWVKHNNGAGLTHKGNCKYCAERAKHSLK